MVIERQRAWEHYFKTRDKEPLILSYKKSIEYMASDGYPKEQRDDLIQVGMLGVCKAADKLDVQRVKSVDAWVFLNVRGMMKNLRQFKPTDSLDEEIVEGDSLTLLDTLADLKTSHEAEDRIFLGHLLGILDQRERITIWWIISGHDKPSIAKHFNISLQTVYNIEKKVIKKLTPLLDND